MEMEKVFWLGSGVVIGPTNGSPITDEEKLRITQTSTAHHREQDVDPISNHITALIFKSSPAFVRCSFILPSESNR